MTAPYMIGDFEFVSLKGMSSNGGPPETVRRTASPVQRPGTAGTGFVTTGVKGRPFAMASMVDVISKSVAQALCVAYEAAVNDELVEVIHAGANYNDEPTSNKYWILDVSASWRRVSTSLGGTCSGPYVVEAVWTLIPVYVAPPPPPPPA